MGNDGEEQSAIKENTGHARRVRKRKVLAVAATAGCVALVVFSLAVLRSKRSIWSSTCQSDLRHGTRLDRSLLEGIHQLRYEQAVLQAERNRLLYNYTASEHAKPDTHEELFLFVAIFSMASYADRRETLRAAWFDDANRQPSVVCKFVLTGSEKTPEIEAESALHGDMLFTDDRLSGYRYIVHKTYFTMEYAVRHYDVRFIMKADDDTFVNVPALVTELRANCHNPGCRNERIYFGREIRNNVVRVAPDDRWRDEDYLNHTSLRTYMPYMMGGGYVLSADLAAVILGINAQAAAGHSLLKFMPNEDVSIGFWLMSVDLRRIDHHKVVTWSHPCCFERSRRKAGTPEENRAWLRPTLDLCREPWLILHKIEHREEMLYLGERLRQCPAVAALRDRARQLAVATRDTSEPFLEQGKVLRLAAASSEGGQHQLGSGRGQLFSASGRMLAAVRLPERAAGAGPGAAPLSVGVFRLAKSAGGTSGKAWSWEHLDTSAAWNTRQGPMLQWLGQTSRYLIFNDLQCPGQPGPAAACAAVYDIQQMSRTRTLPWPIAALSQDGSRALSPSFRRLEAASPGLGYKGMGDDSPASSWQDPCPTSDGLWLMDAFSGRRTLLASLADLFRAVAAGGALAGPADPVTGLRYDGAVQAAPPPAEAARECYHWVEEPVFSREANRAAFRYHIGRCKDGLPGSTRAWRFLLTLRLPPDLAAASMERPAALEDGGLWRVPLVGAVGQHDFGRRGRLLVCEAGGFYEAVDRVGVQRLELPTSVANEAPSHCQYFHDNEQFVLAAVGPPARRCLLVWDRWGKRAHVVGEYAPRPALPGGGAGDAGGEAGPLARGLRPMWSRDGKYVAFDSTHDGQGWQVYLAGVHELQAAMLPSTLARTLSPGELSRARHVYIDLGAGTGRSIRHYLRSAAASPDSIVHAFEPNPLHLGRLRAYARRADTAGRVTVHPQAAWVEDTQVRFSTASAPLVVDPRGRQRRLSWPKRLAAWLARLRWGVPGASAGSMFTPPLDAAHAVTVPAIDFSAWLQRTVQPSDYVVLCVDIAGAEFDTLARLVADGSILLVDRISVKWADGFRAGHTEWPALLEQVFDMLAIPHDNRGLVSG